MTTDAPATIIIPSNPADQKKILDAIKEADESMIRISGERDQIKSIIEQLHEDFPNIDKAAFRKLINHYHKQNIDKVAIDNENIVSLYEAIVS